ncbi:hypothetical protein [Chitinophaga caseinilytica]|uniref:Uncharacterized protein n=1 Tax=Chitinophaga caseinilytica TaxID=2267521 RepID=A0ABZ2ZAJ6_9BACT
MKYICSLLALSIAAAACNSSGTTSGTDSGVVKTDSAPPPSFSPTGIYTGDFGGSPIYISINFARGNNIAGYNTHKGLRRNLHGQMSESANGWKIRLEEPGDHVYDGVFEIHLSKDRQTMEGTWSPLNKDSASAKKFTLKQINSDHHEVYMANENANIQFLEDGSCKLEYYPADSISTGQVEIVRGTWSRNKDTFNVSWKNNAHFGKNGSQFVMYMSADADGGSYPDSLTGEGFTFYQLP